MAESSHKACSTSDRATPNATKQQLLLAQGNSIKMVTAVAAPRSTRGGATTSWLRSSSCLYKLCAAHCTCCPAPASYSLHLAVPSRPAPDGVCGRDRLLLHVSKLPPIERRDSAQRVQSAFRRWSTAWALLSRRRFRATTTRSRAKEGSEPHAVLAFPVCIVALAQHTIGNASGAACRSLRWAHRHRLPPRRAHVAGQAPPRTAAMLGATPTTA